MKILITGDFHIDAVTAGMPRHAEVREAFGQVIDRVRRERIDAVLFLGDLCNPDRGSRTLRSVTAGVEMFRTLVQQTGCAAVLVAGNHDVVQDGSGLSSLGPIRAAHGGREPELGDPGMPRGAATIAPGEPGTGRAGKPSPGGSKAVPGEPGEPQGGILAPCPAYVVPPGVVAVAESPMLLELQGEGAPVHVLALPFVAAHRAYDPPSLVDAVAAWRAQQGAGCPLIGAGHLCIEGALVGSETTDMARGRNVELPISTLKLAGAKLIVNGHYHKRQTVRGVECPGSLVRLTFGEEHNEPRWLEVEL